MADSSHDPLLRALAAFRASQGNDLSVDDFTATLKQEGFRFYSTEAITALYNLAKRQFEENDETPGRFPELEQALNLVKDDIVWNDVAGGDIDTGLSGSGVFNLVEGGDGDADSRTASGGGGAEEDLRPPDNAAGGGNEPADTLRVQARRRPVHPGGGSGLIELTGDGIPDDVPGSGLLDQGARSRPESDVGEEDTAAPARRDSTAVTGRRPPSAPSPRRTEQAPPRPRGARRRGPRVLLLALLLLVLGGFTFFAWKYPKYFPRQASRDSSTSMNQNAGASSAKTPNPAPAVETEDDVAARNAAAAEARKKAAAALEEAREDVRRTLDELTGKRAKFDELVQDLLDETKPLGANVVANDKLAQFTKASDAAGLPTRASIARKKADLADAVDTKALETIDEWSTKAHAELDGRIRSLQALTELVAVEGAKATSISAGLKAQEEAAKKAEDLRLRREEALNKRVQWIVDAVKSPDGDADIRLLASRMAWIAAKRAQQVRATGWTKGEIDQVSWEGLRDYLHNGMPEGIAGKQKLDWFKTRVEKLFLGENSRLQKQACTPEEIADWAAYLMCFDENPEYPIALNKLGLIRLESKR